MATKALDTDALEILQLLAQVVVGFKRTGIEPPRELREAAERAELGPRHVVPLLALSFEEELSVSELAERLGLSLPTTSQLVGELSRAGLLHRHEDERDRRVTLVRVPDAYRETVQGLLLQRADPVRRTLGRLSPSVRAGFLEGMRALAEESVREP